MQLIMPAMMQAATMQGLLLLLPLLLLPVAILLLRRASLAKLKSAIALARNPIIFITDFAKAHYLLVQSSRTTPGGGGAVSNRPPSMAPSAVLSSRRFNNINSSPYGPHWRALRVNLTSGVLHPTHLHRYAAVRRRALAGLVADLKEQQLANGVVRAAESIRSAMFRVVSTMCFGDGIDPAVAKAMADVQTELVHAMATVRTFVFVPFLAVSKLIFRKKWSRLAGIRRKQEELYLSLIDGCRRNGRPDSDETPTSYAHTLVNLQVPVEGEQKEQRRLMDGELVGLCSEFLGASTESTSAAVQWILANLMKRPEIQEAVQKEIDAAVDADAEEVGEEVLGKLDHLNAVVLEAFRLHPTTKMAFRQVMEEDQVVLDGQPIPAGTKIVFPLGALARDKTVWDDPDEFKPERFHGCKEITKKLLSMAAELKMFPFGGGRRMCPAINVSVLHISYFAANLLREFEWREAEGEHTIQLLSDDVIEMFNFMKRPLRAHLVVRRQEGKKFR